MVVVLTVRSLGNLGGQEAGVVAGKQSSSIGVGGVAEIGGVVIGSQVRRKITLLVQAPYELFSILHLSALAKALDIETYSWLAPSRA